MTVESSPRPRLPRSAVVTCAVALAAPIAAWLATPSIGVADVGFLFWMTSLIPAFVLTYHLGRRGAVLALVAGTLVLAAGAAVLAVRGVALPDWRLTLGLVAVFVGVTVGVAVLSERLEALRRNTERQALTDPLTGLPNRRHTQIVLQVAFDAARRGLPLSVCLVDIDRFRWLNDQHGYAAGDRVLKVFSSILSDGLGEGEAVGRWGGGEFLVVLPGVTLDDATRRMEAVRAAFGAVDLPWRPLSASGGVAGWVPDLQGADGLVARAAEALEHAKTDGRNRIEALRVDGALSAPESAPPSSPAPPGPATPPSAEVAAAAPPAATAGGAGSARIVVIDDEATNLRAFGRGLAAMGFADVQLFQDGGTALAAIESSGVDLILLDLQMEPIDGFGVLERLKPLLAREGYLPVIILTGERDPKVKERALRMGARDFVNKPVDLTELRARILNLLETRRLHREVRDSAHQLEDRVRERTQELEQARAEILSRLARAAEYRDDATGAHQQRVGDLAALLAARMGLDEELVDVLRQAAPLHDIGKIGIPDSILRKPGPLTPAEYAFMKQHTRLGAELLAGSRNTILEAARVIAASHHERWDGSGYPAGLVGRAIPVEGRIVAVADAFDSLTHRRSYKAAVPLADTMGRLLRDAGTALDPAVTDALEVLYREGALDPFVEDAG
ncbi:HD domain-containing phosphohydrolase [Gemmatimonadota bacterium Y43]|uniref:HD domain-containing phosphohydrolase n=1 Tax=Gaopeijia maritima TaxID=3119007 RepID=UPI00326C09CC